jgi:hypothetical protein
MLKRRFMAPMVIAGLALLLGCRDTPLEDIPTGPPVAVAYDAVCAEAYADRQVVVEGALHLFPRLLACYAGGNAPSGRACQIKLLPDRSAPTGSVEIERAYYTVFIDEGRGPSRLDPRGYGIAMAPQPAKVFDADSARVDPYDRVRITGTLNARTQGTVDGPPDRCSITDVTRIERAARPDTTWADEQQARRDSIQVRIDSLRAVADSLNAANDARRAARAAAAQN